MNMKHGPFTMDDFEVYQEKNPENKNMYRKPIVEEDKQTKLNHVIKKIKCGNGKAWPGLVSIVRNQKIPPTNPKALTFFGLRNNIREKDRDVAVYLKAFEKFFTNYHFNPYVNVYKRVAPRHARFFFFNNYIYDLTKAIKEMMTKEVYILFLKQLFNKIDYHNNKKLNTWSNKFSRWSLFTSRKDRSKTRVFLDVLHILFTTDEERKKAFKAMLESNHKPLCEDTNEQNIQLDSNDKKKKLIKRLGLLKLTGRGNDLRVNDLLKNIETIQEGNAV